MNETPGISESPEASHIGLSADFLAHLATVRAMMASPVHRNLDRWMIIGAHAFVRDTGGGD